MVKEFDFIDQGYKPSRNDLICLFRAGTQSLLRLEGSLRGGFTSWRVQLRWRLGYLVRD